MHWDQFHSILIQICRPLQAMDFPSHSQQADRHTDRHLSFINIDIPNALTTTTSM